MHFKLDENADPRWREPLVQAGYSVSTVAEESLRGADDEVIAEVCRKESLCLITADLDFAQILNYPPEQYVGLIILHHPRPTLARMVRLIRQVVLALSRGESPAGHLWIVEPGRLYENPSEFCETWKRVDSLDRRCPWGAYAGSNPG